jgi:hypothetical protein
MRELGGTGPGADRAVPDDVGRRSLLPPLVAFVGTALAFGSVTLAAGAPTPLLLFFEHKWGFHAGLLTIAFAIYAFGLLSALLIVGSLSDYRSARRPVSHVMRF